MPTPAVALIGAASSVAGSAIASNSAKSAANKAAEAETQASTATIAEQRRQFDAMQKLLAPYVQMGNQALTAQGNLIGLGGTAAQQQAIAALQSSPAYTSAISAGENAILQNSSATGGLRGGNLQNALARFRPELLAQLIQSQYANLGGLTAIGQNAAAGTGNAGMQTATSIGNSLTQAGAARASAAIAGGQASVSATNSIASAIPTSLLLARQFSGGTTASSMIPDSYWDSSAAAPVASGGFSW